MDNLCASIITTVPFESGSASSRQFIGPKIELPISPEQENRRKSLLKEKEIITEQLKTVRKQETVHLAEWEMSLEKQTEKKEKLPVGIKKIISIQQDKRTLKQSNQLRDYYLGLQPKIKLLSKKIADLELEITKLAPLTTLVMQELDKPRESFVFHRGNFLEKMETVEPGLPSALVSDSSEKMDRLALARWIVDSDNPLSARVVVNRAWSDFFGSGLVSTEEDFGTQGESPSHPQLLDYLAVEFMKQGWSLKRLHRLIVTSSTYRQSSRLTSELKQKDPNNRLFARASRRRLSAELIRDNALAVSGLLSEKMHGPPIFPLQPDDVWNVTGAVDNTYQTSKGEDQYRRGIYVVWRRSSPYPSFVNFDAPDRAACVVKRPNTNTPLQALTLMNDPVYLEAAKALATRILTDRKDLTIRERVIYGFRLCLARTPRNIEIDSLENIYLRELSRLEQAPETADELLGMWKYPQGTNPVQLAAWFYVAEILFNLDETITKG